MAETGSRQIFIAHVAAGQTVRDAARLANIPERTAYRIHADPATRRRIDELRRADIVQALALLTHASVAAAARLSVLVHSGNERIALLASRAVVELRSKLHESEELERRIADLERLAKEKAA